MAGCKCPLMVRGWCGDGVGSWVDSMWQKKGERKWKNFLSKKNDEHEEDGSWIALIINEVVLERGEDDVAWILVEFLGFAMMTCVGVDKLVVLT